MCGEAIFSSDELWPMLMVLLSAIGAAICIRFLGGSLKRKRLVRQLDEAIALDDPSLARSLLSRLEADAKLRFGGLQAARTVEAENAVRTINEYRKSVVELEKRHGILIPGQLDEMSVEQVHAVDSDGSPLGGALADAVSDHPPDAERMGTERIS